MPKKKEALALSGSVLHPNALGTGFLVRIRMMPEKEAIAYARYQQETGAIVAVSPVGKKTKKPIFSDAVLSSPTSGRVLEYSEIEATTPNGKTKLAADALMSKVVTPNSKTEYTLLRLSSQPTIFAEHASSAVEQFNQAMAQEAEQAYEKMTTLGEGTRLPAPEFRGGTVILTAKDVQFRACKTKKIGGHRSLYPAPTSVMNNQSAKNCAIQNGFYSKKFNRWDWGHLLPAGGSPRGAEVNLDLYNFLAVPATLNTWQMVPELIARHLAEAGFEVEYTALGRAEKTSTGEYGFIAKEIYTTVKLLHHGIEAEFYTTRETHQVPCTADAVHIISEFYKLAGKPYPVDLQEKFEKVLAEKIAECRKELPEVSFVSPEKENLIPAKKRPYMAPAKGLQEDPVISRRLNFKYVNAKKTKVEQPDLDQDKAEPESFAISTKKKIKKLKK